MTSIRELDLEVVRRAMEEDASDTDLTSLALVPPGLEARARIEARAEGVVSGLALAKEVFRLHQKDARFDSLLSDGDRVEPGTVLATVQCEARALLAAERTALNYLGHLSGIATTTARFVAAVAPYPGTVVADTRKTTPGLRHLEKQAVQDGGGWSHRADLASGLLVKENHLVAAGSSHPTATPFEGICQASVEAARVAGVPVGIEVETFGEFETALHAGPDFILLDNMSPEEVSRCVARRGPNVTTPLLEVSGGIDLEGVAGYAAAGVDRISIGRITHSAPALDLTLLLESVLEPTGRPVLRTVRTESTMDALWQLVDTGLAGVGSVFRAETQTRGRGRRGHTWDSRPGLGLWFSIVLPVGEESRILMAVTAAVSVAVVRTLRAFLPGHESRIRWPNDIRIEGRKLCGILVETRTDHPGLAIAGIGLDVLHTPLDFPPELRDQATSLALVAGRPLDREPIFVRLLDELDIVVASLSCSAIEEIERPWREASETLGSEVEIEFDGQRFQGRVKSLSLQQGLTLEFPDGEERTFRGEHVQLLD